MYKIRKRKNAQWVDKQKIATVYEKCYELNDLWGTNFTVDHIASLQGKNVCGLHVWENLQLLERSLNSSKSNNESSDRF